LINIVEVEDDDAPIEAGVNYINDEDEKGTLFGLNDPSYPMVAMVCYIYQQESYVCYALNNSSRQMDASKVDTLGPYASAIFKVMAGTQKNRTDIDINKYRKCNLYRGGGMTEDEI
jgi:hypothetical protein